MCICGGNKWGSNGRRGRRQRIWEPRWHKEFKRKFSGKEEEEKREKVGFRGSVLLFRILGQQWFVSKKCTYQLAFLSWLTNRFTSFIIPFRLSSAFSLFLSGVYVWVYVDLASSDLIYVHFVSPNRFNDCVFRIKYNRLVEIWLRKLI